MSVKLYLIQQFSTTSTADFGSLSITPCPQGDEHLSEEVDRLKLAGIDTVISLLDATDQDNLGLQQEGTSCEQSGVEFLQLPIKDFGLPDYRDAISLGHRILSIIHSGKNVAVHCRAGIGRSGMISATVLVLSGMEPGAALELLEEKRCRKVPDTEEQRQWILELPRFI